MSLEGFSLKSMHKTQCVPQVSALSPWWWQHPEHCWRSLLPLHSEFLVCVLPGYLPVDPSPPSALGLGLVIFHHRLTWCCLNRFSDFWASLNFGKSEMCICRLVCKVRSDICALLIGNTNCSVGSAEPGAEQQQQKARQKTELLSPCFKAGVPVWRVQRWAGIRTDL